MWGFHRAAWVRSDSISVSAANNEIFWPYVLRVLHTRWRQFTPVHSDTQGVNLHSENWLSELAFCGGHSNHDSCHNLRTDERVAWWKPLSLLFKAFHNKWPCKDFQSKWRSLFSCVLESDEIREGFFQIYHGLVKEFLIYVVTNRTIIISPWYIETLW